MKKPKNMATTKKCPELTKEEEVVVEITETKPYNWCFTDYEDDKKVLNYIKSIERLVRGSLEYRNYIKYLKEEQDLTQCAFFKNIDISKINGVTIEFHHYPFNLYEIVDTVLKAQTGFYSHYVNTFDIANEVMRLHYENMVGLVPLSTTVHELAHNGEVFINFDAVYGNVQGFMDTYHDYIDPELISTIKRLDELSEKHAMQSNNFILKKKFQKIIMEDREIKTYTSNNGEAKLIA
jgi:hypothetical protein